MLFLVLINTVMNTVSEAATYISTFLGASKKCTLKGLDGQCLFVIADNIFAHMSTQFFLEGGGESL